MGMSRDLTTKLQSRQMLNRRKPKPSASVKSDATRGRNRSHEICYFIVTSNTLTERYETDAQPRIDYPRLDKISDSYLLPTENDGPKAHRVFFGAGSASGTVTHDLVNLILFRDKMAIFAYIEVDFRKQNRMT